MGPPPVADDDTGGGNNSQTINEEYKIWKKNTPFLYDTVITHALTWPSLTCQWFPDQTSPEGADYTVHRMLLGTHSSGKGVDQLMIAEVMLPKVQGEASGGKDVTALYDEDRQELGSYGDSKARIRVTHTINHEGEINRARYMPQNVDMLATKAINGDVNIFDRKKHPSRAPAGGESKPDIILKGLKREGYGLSWSPVKEGHIASAGEDDFVAHWDIGMYNKKSPTLEPLRKYHGHIGQINDVDWHHTFDYMFASVGDDKLLNIWDTRSDSAKADKKLSAHSGEINAVSFAPSNEYMILTGSADTTVGLWDIRNLDRKLHSFESHTGSITQLAWSPHSPLHFASAAEDRRVHIWNLDHIGAEQTPDDAEDGPPELMFVHGGHTSTPSDLSWSPSARWYLSSTSEDNVLQVWEPSRHLRAEGEDVDAMELE